MLRVTVSRCLHPERLRQHRDGLTDGQPAGYHQPPPDGGEPSLKLTIHTGNEYEKSLLLTISNGS